IAGNAPWSIMRFRIAIGATRAVARVGPGATVGEGAGEIEGVRCASFTPHAAARLIESRAVDMRAVSRRWFIVLLRLLEQWSGAGGLITKSSARERDDEAHEACAGAARVREGDAGLAEEAVRCFAARRGVERQEACDLARAVWA